MSTARVRGPGHPDVACDLVAASIVEEYLRRDPNSQLDIRVIGGRGVLFVSGDILSQADFDVSAVVRRVLAQCGYLTQIEPFIAFEQMNPAWGPKLGARETVAVHGFATAALPDRLPAAASLARSIARLIERKRLEEEEWYWIGNDYEVQASEQNGERSVIIRAQHIDQIPVGQVRERLTDLCKRDHTLANVKVNLAGEETRAGLAERIGSSGKAASLDQYGLAIPANVSGVGLKVSHPINLGTWVARQIAKSLIDLGHGQAVQVSLEWEPFETRPQRVRIRNERGQDLTPLVSKEKFDLSLAPFNFQDPGLLTAAIRAPFDGRIRLPWEESNAVL